MLAFSCKNFRSDRKSTRLNSSHTIISYAVLCLKKKQARRPHKTQQGPPTATSSGPATPRTATHQPAPLPRRATASRYFGTKLDGGFFFNDTATTEIYTLSLHDALPI